MERGVEMYGGEARIRFRTQAVRPEEEIFKQRKEKLFAFGRKKVRPLTGSKKWERTVCWTHPEGLPPSRARRNGRIGSSAFRRTGLDAAKARQGHVRESSGRDGYAAAVYFQFDKMGWEKTEYGFVKKWVDTGRLIGVEGHPFRTQRGELTILVTKCTLLSKALRTDGPTSGDGLKDTEVRISPALPRSHRTIPDVQERVPEKFVPSLSSVAEDARDSRRTLEVETHRSFAAAAPEGANARPFKTFHNALGARHVLRIATELH
jgi:lysyl-tRNA synthetase class 2